MADATVTSANLKIDALQKESDALINQANNLEYVARMWALYNQAKMGEITPEQYKEAKSKVKFGN
uniref:Short C-terminal domain protein n=1 Tax=Bacteriophage sp. TaxID=38018 RepID=A0A8D9UHS2_9VIRU|nr:MAG TPA: Short C-terminal domain protein [Bacteriophage sp.]